MDAGFLNFHKEEEFSSYFLSCEDESQSYNAHSDNDNFHWTLEPLEHEREINGDVALIPVSGDTNFTLSTSPPIREDINKIMTDWNHLVNLDVGNDLVADMAVCSSTTLQLEAAVMSVEPTGTMDLHLDVQMDCQSTNFTATDNMNDDASIAVDDLKPEGFDITKFVVGNQEEGLCVSPQECLADAPDAMMDQEVVELHEEGDINAEEQCLVGSTLDMMVHKDNSETSAHELQVEDDIKAEGFDITKFIVGSELDMSMQEEDFDITKYVNGSDTEHVELHSSPEKSATDDEFVEVLNTGSGDVVPKFGGKRIDMARGRYLVDDSSDDNEDDDISIDVETVDDNLTPVLQAGDLNSLLEQFEATESTNMELQPKIVSTSQVDGDEALEADLSLDVFVEQVKLISPIKSPPKPKVVHTKRNLDFREFSQQPAKSRDLQVEKVKSDQSVVNRKGEAVKVKNDIQSEPKAKRKIDAPSSCAPPVPSNETKRTKQILNELPVDLIDRIRQSSKRKAVPVIEPIAPTKRRNCIANSSNKDKTTATTNSRQVSPARTITPVVTTNSNKCDKAIENSINDKPETIKDNKNVHLDHDYCTSASQKDSGFSSCEEDEKTVIRTQPTVKSSDGKLMVSLLKTNTIKKKLNLEEYKKRLQSKPGEGSPLVHDDDENTRRLKHTEMLMKLAHDRIKDSKNSEKDVVSLPPIIPAVAADSTEPIRVKVEAVNAEPVKPPKHIIMKTLVSVGTNTEETWGQVEQILQNAQVKISPNSLISSIVEHLPKPKPVIPDQQVEHGEDKTIVFIDTTQKKKKMSTISVQTDHTSLKTTYRRRRTSSSSSSSSYTSTSSNDDSMGGSRTPSPVRRRMQEQLKVIEERRIIYVGRIEDGTTKDELHRRFKRFGPISKVSVHFRQHGDNYGFVTFIHKEDAYEAIEHANDDDVDPQYDLRFGGRRLFCQTSYADLDNMQEDLCYDFGWLQNPKITQDDDNSFDNLLRKAQAKLRNRKL